MSLTKVTPSMIDGLPWKTVEEFKAANDTLTVQAAFDSGVNLIFTKSYSVDSVKISGTGQTIDFAGYGLVGTRPLASTAAQYVLAITGTYLNLKDVNVSADFKNYNCAIRWFSETTGTPAQYNVVDGMRIYSAVVGLVYGQEQGTASVNAPQSENTIYGFYSRSVQQPFVGNQQNGVVTLVAPTLDCNPFEWASQAGYNATTFNTAAVAIKNLVGYVMVLGGEILKTSSQLGYGMYGGNLSVTNSFLEIASSQMYVTHGNISFTDIQSFNMSGDTVPGFVLDAAATGDINFTNSSPSRADNVWSYSGAVMFKGTTTAAMRICFSDCALSNWRKGFIASDAVSVVGTETSNAILSFLNTRFINTNGSGAIVTNFLLPNTDSVGVTANAVASATTIETNLQPKMFHVSGTAAIATIEPPFTSFRGALTLIPDAAFTTTTADNIAIATTAVVGKALTMTYDGVKWYPSY